MASGGVEVMWGAGWAEGFRLTLPASLHPRFSCMFAGNMMSSFLHAGLCHIGLCSMISHISVLHSASMGQPEQHETEEILVECVAEFSGSAGSACCHHRSRAVLSFQRQS